MADASHPRTVVFVARHNEIDELQIPPAAFTARRAEGTLVTTDRVLADRFAQAATVTDDDLAVILGYPQSKSEIHGASDCCVIQAIDRDGNVIFEAATSPERSAETRREAERHLTDNGLIRVCSLADALQRRISRT